jgi:hypothetical protein
MALIEPDDVRRLFRVLVDLLAQRNPERLRSAFQVAELYQQIIPYKSYRSRLGFDTNQDYEAAVLGLLGGIGEFASVEPLEAQESLAAEAASPNPDTGLFREFAGARVWLHADKVRELVDRAAAYAPPAATAPPEPPAESADAGRPPVFLLERDAAAPPAARPRPAAPPDSSRCSACTQPLPGDRPVVFCPWCGRPLGGTTCARCGDELDPAWGFCPRCGTRRTQ